MFSYIPFGDAALILKAGETIDPGVNAMVRKMLYVLDQQNITGVTDLIPSYNELLICYDPFRFSLAELVSVLKELGERLSSVSLPDPCMVCIPVSYGGEWGPDLQVVAGMHGLTEREVVAIHTSVDYHVYMLGFTPGFCYLGGMDPRIATPRKESPRLRVAAGAVGIAGSQTGIYPVESPGGWQIIGRTGTRLFDPDRDPPFLVKPGDVVRFERC